MTVHEVSYHPGDTIQANCTLEKTFPVPNITWFINDREVDVIYYILEQDFPQTLKSVGSGEIFYKTLFYTLCIFKLGNVCRGMKIWGGKGAVETIVATREPVTSVSFSS